MFPKLHCLKIVGSILAVDKVGELIKLRGFDTHTVRSVLHKTVTETPVTHLCHESHILLALFFVLDFSAV